jgi:hypothetical protein
MLTTRIIQGIGAAFGAAAIVLWIVAMAVISASSTQARG